ncbi:hypothetical protein CUR178_00154 [Leishmania enriettii]|uniref:non-specific serine/threonine protein kinase n=1 Tax=Leishmania enriettii TaxID=5663 RepID=A0A836G0J1_LEIEN|nr:hypothetical protein CUR178_00154 [Leishmania enriettii]
MAAPSDALIKKVCNAFPSTFGVETEGNDAAESNCSRPFRYYLDLVLGSGTSGTVLYARRVRDEHPFAVKVMDVEGYTSQEIMRASGEVCCLLSCDYFSIVKCHEDFVYRDERNPESVSMMAMVLDYANAGDLRHEIRNRSKTNRPFAEHEAGLLFLQVLLGVHHVHSKHMIHRDIKSANILLCSNGLVKLGDFGFSKMYANTVSDDVGRTFCGTPYYVAPEIWRRCPYSKKADMFSLGVLLYELLTLKRPFDGANMHEVMHKTLAGRFDPLPSNISPEMRDIVTALLSGDPSRRPSSSRLLNMPICKLFLSGLLEIVQTQPAFQGGLRDLISSQIQETKRLLVTEKRHIQRMMEESSGSSVAASTTILEGATPLTTTLGGLTIHEGTVKKQSSDMVWKKRYLCIRAELADGQTVLDMNPKFKTLDMVLAISKETMEQQCISTPFTELEDAFPVPAKYTGCNASFVFAVAFKTGKRLSFQTKSEMERDLWMEKIQDVLGIGDGDDDLSALPAKE